MQIFLFVISGVGWLVASLLIFRFIVTVADDNMKNLKFGVLTIILSYLAGMGLLFFNLMTLYGK
jgi:hypothetical protein